MTPSTPVQDLATQWSSARKLYPIYFELAREFAIDVKPCADLEAMVDTPGKETVEGSFGGFSIQADHLAHKQP